MSSSSDEELVVRNPYIAIASDGRRSSRKSHVSREQESKNRALEEMRRARNTGSVHRVDVWFYFQTFAICSAFFFTIRFREGKSVFLYLPLILGSKFDKTRVRGSW